MDFWRSLAGQRSGSGRSGSTSAAGKVEADSLLQKASPEQLAAQLQHVLSQLRSTQSTDVRVGAIEELSKLAYFYDISYEIDEAWETVRCLIEDSEERNRRCGWKFIAAAAEGNYQHLGARRKTFLRALAQPLNHGTDFSLQVELLLLLTRDGKDTSGVESELSIVADYWCRAFADQLASRRAGKAVKGAMDVSTLRPIGGTAGLISTMDEAPSSRVSGTNTPHPVSVMKFTLPLREMSILVEFVGRALRNRTVGMTGTAEATLLQDVARLLSLTVDPQIRSAFATEELGLDVIGDEAIRALEGVWEQCPMFPTVVGPIVRAFCCAIGFHSTFERAWRSIKGLLQSTFRHTVSQTLCDILDTPDGIEGQNSARGAIFCLGMASWGAKSGFDFTIPRNQVLRSFSEATLRRWDVLDYEILVALHRLVHHSDVRMQQTEWLTIIEILVRLKRHHKASVDDRTPKEDDNDFGVAPESDSAPSALSLYSNLLRSIRKLKMQSSESVISDIPDSFMDLQLELCGVLIPSVSPMDFYQSSAAYAALHPSQADQKPAFVPGNSRKLLPSSVVIDVLNYVEASQRLYPTNGYWMNLLIAVSQSFYAQETRSKVRRRYLEIAFQLYWSLREKDRLTVLQNVLLPFIYDHLVEERDADIFPMLTQFAKQVFWRETSAVSTGAERLLRALFRCARQEMARGATDCAELAVQLFLGCLDGSHGNSKWAPLVFENLVSIANSSVGKNRDARMSALKCLLDIRADSDYRLWFAGRENIPTRGSTIDFGTYSAREETEPMITQAFVPSVVCYVAKEDTEDLTPMQLSAVSIQQGSKESVDDSSSISNDSVNDDPMLVAESDILIVMDSMVDLLVEIMRNEADFEVYSLVMDKLAVQLNFLRVFEHSRLGLQRLRTVLCDSILNDQLAPNLKLPKTVRKADLYVRAYRLLAGLIPYAKQSFSKSDQDEIVGAFQLGLTKWTQTARPCTHALLLCMYELPLSMVKHLAGTLDRMGRIMSTTAIAVHILEFLVSLIKTPNLWANFVEADYQRVFAIALRYILHAASAPPSAGPQPGTSSTKSESIHPHPRETANASQSHFSPVAQNALAQYVIFLAYHTITLWFSSIRLSDRRKFVPYILRNLALANGTSRPIDERIEVCVDMLMRFSFANAEPKPQKSLVTRVMFDDAPAGQVLTKTWLQGNALLTIRVLKSSCWAEISIRRPTGTTVFLSRLENKFRGEDIDVVSVASIFMTGIEAPASNIAEDIQATPLHRHGRVGSDSNITSAASNTETTGGSESLRRSRTNPSSGRPFIRSTLTDGATKSSETTDGPVSSDSSARDAQWSSMSSSFTLEPLLRTKTEAGNGYNAIRKDDLQLFEPAFVFSSLSLFPDHNHRDEVRLLPDNAATSRALSVMDLTPLMDHFNVGVVYVGPGQTTEVEILQNTGGSAAYNEFLAGLGKFVKLKGRKDIYAGGLNTDDDIDGSEAVLWNEGGGQVIFHCATLMPNYEHDPNCTAKKRHIGNDFVLIVWNESGRPFGFRTIPSQFNFINIIIEPVDARYSSGTEGSRRTPDNTYFRLMTQRREDMPEFGPVSEPKLVSAISIPALVRHLAITADVFSQLFQKQGDGTTLEEWVSNWRTRLRDIKRVREQSQPGHTVPSRQGSVANVVSPSQLPNTSSGAGPRGLYNGQSQMDQLDVVLDFTRNT